MAITIKEIEEYMKALPINGPCLLMVDEENVDVQLLAHSPMKGIPYPIVIIPVLGKPTAELLTKDMLERALEKMNQ